MDIELVEIAIREACSILDAVEAAGDEATRVEWEDMRPRLRELLKGIRGSSEPVTVGYATAVSVLRHAPDLVGLIRIRELQ